MTLNPPFGPAIFLLGIYPKESHKKPPQECTAACSLYPQAGDKASIQQKEQG